MWDSTIEGARNLLGLNTGEPPTEPAIAPRDVVVVNPGSDQVAPVDHSMGAPASAPPFYTNTTVDPIPFPSTIIGHGSAINTSPAQSVTSTQTISTAKEPPAPSVPQPRDGKTAQPQAVRPTEPRSCIGPDETHRDFTSSAGKNGAYGDDVGCKLDDSGADKIDSLGPQIETTNDHDDKTNVLKDFWTRVTGKKRKKVLFNTCNTRLDLDICDDETGKKVVSLVPDRENLTIELAVGKYHVKPKDCSDSVPLFHRDGDSWREYHFTVSECEGNEIIQIPQVAEIVEVTFRFVNEGNKEAIDIRCFESNECFESDEKVEELRRTTEVPQVRRIPPGQYYFTTPTSNNDTKKFLCHDGPARSRSKTFIVEILPQDPPQVGQIAQIEMTIPAIWCAFHTSGIPQSRDPVGINNSMGPAGGAPVNYTIGATALVPPSDSKTPRPMEFPSTPIGPSKCHQNRDTTAPLCKIQKREPKPSEPFNLTDSNLDPTPPKPDIAATKAGLKICGDVGANGGDGCGKIGDDGEEDTIVNEADIRPQEEQVNAEIGDDDDEDTIVNEADIQPQEEQVNAENPNMRSVSFAPSLEIRHYASVLGDNPCCNKDGGLALELSWEHEAPEFVNVDLYEKHRQNLSQLELSYGDRLKRLEASTGLSEQELLQEQRARADTNTLEEMMRTTAADDEGLPKTPVATTNEATPAPRATARHPKRSRSTENLLPQEEESPPRKRQKREPKLSESTIVSTSAQGHPNDKPLSTIIEGNEEDSDTSTSSGGNEEEEDSDRSTISGNDKEEDTSKADSSVPTTSHIDDGIAQAAKSQNLKKKSLADTNDEAPTSEAKKTPPPPPPNDTSAPPASNTKATEEKEMCTTSTATNETKPGRSEPVTSDETPEINQENHKAKALDLLFGIGGVSIPKKSVQCITVTTNDEPMQAAPPLILPETHTEKQPVLENVPVAASMPAAAASAAMDTSNRDYSLAHSMQRRQENQMAIIGGAAPSRDAGPPDSSDEFDQDADDYDKKPAARPKNIHIDHGQRNHFRIVEEPLFQGEPPLKKQKVRNSSEPTEGISSMDRLRLETTPSTEQAEEVASGTPAASYQSFSLDTSPVGVNFLSRDSLEFSQSSGETSPIALNGSFDGSIMDSNDANQSSHPDFRGQPASRTNERSSEPSIGLESTPPNRHLAAGDSRSARLTSIFQTVVQKDTHSPPQSNPHNQANRDATNPALRDKLDCNQTVNSEYPQHTTQKLNPAPLDEARAGNSNDAQDVGITLSKTSAANACKDESKATSALSLRLEGASVADNSLDRMEEVSVLNAEEERGQVDPQVTNPNFSLVVKVPTTANNAAASSLKPTPKAEGQKPAGKPIDNDPAGKPIDNDPAKKSEEPAVAKPTADDASTILRNDGFAVLPENRRPSTKSNAARKVVPKPVEGEGDKDPHSTRGKDSCEDAGLPVASDGTSIGDEDTGYPLPDGNEEEAPLQDDDGTENPKSETEEDNEEEPGEGDAGNIFWEGFWRGQEEEEKHISDDDADQMAAEEFAVNNRDDAEMANAVDNFGKTLAKAILESEQEEAVHADHQASQSDLAENPPQDLPEEPPQNDAQEAGLSNAVRREVRANRNAAKSRVGAKSVKCNKVSQRKVAGKKGDGNCLADTTFMAVNRKKFEKALIGLKEFRAAFKEQANSGEYPSIDALEVVMKQLCKGWKVRKVGHQYTSLRWIFTREKGVYVIVFRLIYKLLAGQPESKRVVTEHAVLENANLEEPTTMDNTAGVKALIPGEAEKTNEKAAYKAFFDFLQKKTADLEKVEVIFMRRILSPDEVEEEEEEKRKELEEKRKDQEAAKLKKTEELESARDPLAVPKALECLLKRRGVVFSTELQKKTLEHPLKMKKSSEYKDVLNVALGELGYKLKSIRGSSLCKVENLLASNGDYLAILNVTFHDGKGSPEMTDALIFTQHSKKAELFNRNTPDDKMALTDGERKLSKAKEILSLFCSRLLLQPDSGRVTAFELLQPNPVSGHITASKCSIHAAYKIERIRPSNLQATTYIGGQNRQGNRHPNGRGPAGHQRLSNSPSDPNFQRQGSRHDNNSWEGSRPGNGHQRHERSQHRHAEPHLTNPPLEGFYDQRQDGHGRGGGNGGQFGHNQPGLHGDRRRDDVGGYGRGGGNINHLGRNGGREFFDGGRGGNAYGHCRPGYDQPRDEECRGNSQMNFHHHHDGPSPYDQYQQCNMAPPRGHPVPPPPPPQHQDGNMGPPRDAGGFRGHGGGYYQAQGRYGVHPQPNGNGGGFGGPPPQRHFGGGMAQHGQFGGYWHQPGGYDQQYPTPHHQAPAQNHPQNQQFDSYATYHSYQDVTPPPPSGRGGQNGGRGFGGGRGRGRGGSNGGRHRRY